MIFPHVWISGIFTSNACVRGRGTLENFDFPLDLHSKPSHYPYPFMLEGSDVSFAKDLLVVNSSQVESFKQKCGFRLRRLVLKFV